MAKTAKSSKSRRTTNVAASAPTRIIREEVLPEDYQPIGMWGYFGYEFLFNIPIIGWVICISFALMARNHNLRNFARSKFCWLIIWIVVFCLLAAFGILQAMFNALGM